MSIEIIIGGLSSRELRYVDKDTNLEDLFRFKHRKMTSRLRKKFLKHPFKYGAKYIRRDVWLDYQISCWGRVADAVRDILGRESFMRKILPVKSVNAA